MSSPREIRERQAAQRQITQLVRDLDDARTTIDALRAVKDTLVAELAVVQEMRGREREGATQERAALERAFDRERASAAAELAALALQLRIATQQVRHLMGFLRGKSGSFLPDNEVELLAAELDAIAAAEEERT